MSKETKIMAVFFVVLVLGAGNVCAEIIEINISAEITYVLDPYELLNGQLGVGDILSGSYIYESSTLDSAPGTSIGRYEHHSPPYGISLTSGGFTFQTDPDNVDFWVEVGNNNVTTTDNYLIRSYNNLPLYDNVSVGTIDWQLDDSIGTALSSDALPTTPPVLEDWDFDWGIRIVGGIEHGKGFFIRAFVTYVELVPYQPKTYYVNASEGSDDNDGLSPQTAFATIQKAIDSAFDGDMVIVADGTYTGPGNRDIDFLGKAITVRSTDPNDPNVVAATIIGHGGCQYGWNWPNGFTFVNSEDTGSVLCGFTIKGFCGFGIHCKDSSPRITNCVVKGGIYCDQSSPTITNCTINQGIYCDGSSPEVINCTITESEWSGIYCRDSNPFITNCTIMSNRAESGGGIYCYDSNPTITNCTITGNSAEVGGGIYCETSSPTITDCIISNNSAEWIGGVLCIKESNPIITNCTIRGNSSKYHAGGIACDMSSPTISNSTISGNVGEYGGGMENWKLSNPKIINCTFTGNTAIRGGGMYNRLWSNPTLNNCRFSGNSADSGGGIFCTEEGCSTLNNCTFSDNTAREKGGGIYCERRSELTITNSILWSNNAPDGAQIYLDHPHYNNCVSYTDIQGGVDNIYVDPDYSLNCGQGNIDTDPCFFEPGYWADANDPNIVVEPNDSNAVWIDGDYHLLLDSPCIDSGDNNSVPADILDLDGNPRFVDRPDIEDTGNGTPPIVDMGAYEAMVSCFGVNHVKLGTKAGKKGNKVEVKGTFDPASPIDFAVDNVTYIIDDGLGYMLTFIIPAGSFEPEGKPDKQKFRFHSAKGSQPDIKARFDFLKCKFELKVKGVMDTSEITAESLAIVLQAGANLVEEVVQVQAKPKHLEFKREPKLNCLSLNMW